MSYRRSNVHPKADSNLDYVKKLDAEGLLVKSDRTNATFDLDLADWILHQFSRFNTKCICRQESSYWYKKDQQ